MARRRGPSSGLDQQTTAWRASDGEEVPHYVALVIERHGASPGPYYVEFVSERSPDIAQQLWAIQSAAAAASSVNEPQPPSSDTARRRKKSDDSTTDMAAGQKRPAPSDTGSVPGRKAKQLEKTHLFVCTNPFALMDELNNDTSSEKVRMHYFLAVVVGRFAHRWCAERFCMLWGNSSRGAGPRASWSDALKTVHGFDMWVDLGIVFEQTPFLEKKLLRNEAAPMSKLVV